MRLSRFGPKRAQNRTRNFFEPVLLESNFIWPSDHQKCVFGCPAFFSSPILRPPGTPFWALVVVQGPISRKRGVFWVFRFYSCVGLEKPEKMSIGSGGFHSGTRAPEAKIDQVAPRRTRADLGPVQEGRKNHLGFFAEI